MSALFQNRVKRVGPDRYRIRLPEPEQELLASLLPQLRELLTTDGPSLRRLFPNAYPDDAERAAGYAAMTRDDLTERRFAAIDAMEETLAGGEVDGETLSQWMRSVNDLRLVLGTNLDVSEDDDPLDIDPSDPEAGAWQIYHYLAALQTWIIEAMTKDL